MAVPNKLVILGNSSASPTLDRHHSSQYFQFDKHHILIDCGEATQNRLLENRIGFNKITHIFISHLHGDHYLGLMGLLNTMALNGRSKALHIFAPAPLKNIMDAHFSVSKGYIDYDIHFHPHKEGSFTIELEHLRVDAFELVHRVPCHGFKFVEKHTRKKIDLEACRELKIPQSWLKRIAKGEDYKDEKRHIHNSKLTLPHDPPMSYCYMSDTRYTPELMRYAKKSTLLYHEATFLHDLVDRAVKTAHSTALEAGKFASQASVNQLIIGHFSSRYVHLEEHLQEARREFPNTELADEGRIFHLEDFINRQ
jgi:ribonuclease Z